MKDNQIRRPFNDNLYEILELNASEPIVFQRDSKINRHILKEQSTNQGTAIGEMETVIILKEFKNIEHVLPLIKQSYEEN
jgi:predicted transport protein